MFSSVVVKSFSSCGVYWLPCTVLYRVSSNLTLLGSGHITCMKRTICRVYSG